MGTLQHKSDYTQPKLCKLYVNRFNNYATTVTVVAEYSADQLCKGLEKHCKKLPQVNSEPAVSPLLLHFQL